MRSLTAFWAIVALGLLVLVGPRLVRRMKAPARRRVPVRGGVLVMRSPARYGIALAICALVPAGVLGAMGVRLWLSGRAGPLGLLEISLATLAALAVAAHQLVAAFRQGFLVDEFGITRVGVLTKRRVRWGDVATFAYNPLHRWFFGTLGDGAHLWVPIETHGIADFAGIALLRVPQKALEPLAREALEELAASESAA
jgi:hypothetical protein